MTGETIKSPPFLSSDPFPLWSTVVAPPYERPHLVVGVEEGIRRLQPLDRLPNGVPWTVVDMLKANFARISDLEIAELARWQKIHAPLSPESVKPQPSPAIYIRCCQCLSEAKMERDNQGTLRIPPGWLQVNAREIALEPVSVSIRICPPCIKPEIRVAAAAIRDFDGQVFSVSPPGRHHDVLHLMVETHNREQLPQAEQGFLLTNGKFVSRKAARLIAERAGQLIPRATNLDWLSSEDVW